MIVLDIEICKGPVYNKDYPNHEYAAGWADFTGMGIAVLCLYDYKDDSYKIWTDKGQCNTFNLSLIEDRRKLSDIIALRDIVAGYNIKKFDAPLMEANGFLVCDDQIYDILEQLWFAVGLSKQFNPRTHGGYGLDTVSKLNLDNQGKTGHGALAPFMWQDGKFQEVIDYCQNDVKLTKDLLDLVFIQGGLIDPKSKKVVKMALPTVVYK